jgi:hypothetical protein
MEKEEQKRKESVLMLLPISSFDPMHTLDDDVSSNPSRKDRLLATYVVINLLSLWTRESENLAITPANAANDGQLITHCSARLASFSI